MARLLYRIGRTSFLHRGWVLAAWVIILASVGAIALTAGGGFSQTFSIPGTESARAQTILDERFGDAAAGVGAGTGSGAQQAGVPATARIVVEAPSGQSLLDGGLQTVLGTLAPLGQTPGVASLSDPTQTKTIAADGSVTYLDVVFAAPIDDVDEQAVTSIEDAADVLRAQGFGVALTGGPFTEPVEVLSGAESVGVVIALVVLLITFGSLLAAGLPILTAILGVAIGAAGVFAVSAVVDTSSASMALALMLGLAVGIDYALFLLSRHRQQLAEGLTPVDSAALAVGTAGNAVVFAGSTVVVALAGLSVVGIPFLTLMGLSAAATVAVAVLVAITLLPAIMGFAGTRLTPRGRAARAAERSARAENPWGRFVTSHPILTLVVASLAMGTVAVPALSMRLGLPDAGQLPTSSQDRQAYDMLGRGFGPGFNGPLVVLVDTAGGGDLAAAVDAMSAQVAALPDVAYVAPASPNQAGDASLMVVIPASGPNDEATADLVSAIRDVRDPVASATGADIAVTGAAAANVDITRQLSNALPEFLAIVVGLAFLLLLVAFRSLLVPLTAVAGFLLAVAAAFGATVAVYQWGWLADVFNVNQAGPLISFLPVLVVGVLFGLAMDYQVFLVSRMREEHAHGAEALTAVRTGFSHGARVVLAAALIMISVFVSFVFGGDSTVGPMAFALAIGIAFDALVVRMSAIPAIMAILGRSAWWVPRWLDRILPDVDLEGAKLEGRAAGARAAGAAAPEDTGADADAVTAPTGASTVADPTGR